MMSANWANLSLVLPIALACGACTAFGPNDVAKPTTLTVENALQDVGAGFAEMNNELQAHKLKLGLYPCKVTVSLKVTASAGEGGKLVLDASTAPGSTAVPAKINTVSASAHAEQTNTSNATRANTISIEMYNAACLPKGVLGADNPTKLSAVINALEKAGYKPMIAPRPQPTQ